jgi:hypothetical protein
MKTKTTINIAVFVLAVAGMLAAQPAVPTFHDGDTIELSVAFDGPDAAKITRVVMNATAGEPAKNQSGFTNNVFPGESRPNGPNAFIVSFKIPANQASGEYQLGEIRAITDSNAPVTLSYTAVADFPATKFKIENRNHIVKPTIKDVHLVSKP